MTQRPRGPGGARSATEGSVPRFARRARPPTARSGAGPIVFLLVIAILAVGAFVVVRPAAEDAFVSYVTDHDTLLKQDFVRSAIAGHVSGELDLAKDVRGETRPFVIRRGETAGEIVHNCVEIAGPCARLCLEAHEEPPCVVLIVSDNGPGVPPDVKCRIFEPMFSTRPGGTGCVLYENEKEDALQSGTYQVSSGLTPRQLATLFEKAPGDQVVLRVIEGWRLGEIATAVNKAFPKISKDAFLAAAVVGDRKNGILSGLDAKTPLEGFLFPDTYFLRPDASPAQIVDTLLAQFEQRAGATLRTAAAARNTTVYELVKLASVVEREARDRAESATIAGVYQNRLDIGMKLDADPTIQYAIGEWRELTLDDLRIDSPYNTYANAGLPPTPICSPGQSALDGAAHPADNDYFYFVAKNDGSGDHAFAKTLEEQEANRVKYGNR